MTITDKLYGLVLAGGKSTRMGIDKGMIAYHGMPHSRYLTELLHPFCDRVFLSMASSGEMDGLGVDPQQILVDRDEFRGPFNGLLTAHNAYPHVSWLVLACDLPLVTDKSIGELIAQRDPLRMATAFAKKQDPLPEPLFAIWEPRGLTAAMAYLEVGNGSCARKFLIRHDAKLVFPVDETVLLNANSLDESQEAKRIIETS